MAVNKFEFHTLLSYQLSGVSSMGSYYDGGLFCVTENMEDCRIVR